MAKSEIAKVIHGSSLLIGDLRMREPVTFRYLCPLESALPLAKPVYVLWLKTNAYILNHPKS